MSHTAPGSIEPEVASSYSWSPTTKPYPELNLGYILAPYFHIIDLNIILLS
jgi:hypothetical protein